MLSVDWFVNLCLSMIGWIGKARDLIGRSTELWEDILSCPTHFYCFGLISKTNKSFDFLLHIPSEGTKNERERFCLQIPHPPDDLIR